MATSTWSMLQPHYSTSPWILLIVTQTIHCIYENGATCSFALFGLKTLTWKAPVDVSRDEELSMAEQEFSSAQDGGGQAGAPGMLPP